MILRYGQGEKYMSKADIIQFTVIGIIYISMIAILIIVGKKWSKGQFAIK